MVERNDPRRERAGSLPLSGGPPRIVHAAAVERCLAAVRRSVRAVRLAEGIGLFLAVAAGGIVILFGLDNIFRLEAAARTVLLAAFGLGLLAVLLLGVLVRPFRPMGDEECALAYDARHPELDDRLINTVLFDRLRLAGIEGAIAERVRAETVAAVGDGPRRRIGSPRRAARAAILAAAALGALAGYRALLPEHFRNALARFARPTRFVAPLSRTVLAVSPGDATISPLEKLRVTAETAGQLPESATIHLSFGAAPAMRFDGRAFVFEVEGQTSDFRYRVHAGDARSDEFRVRVRKLPAVEEVEIVVRPPSYTGLPPETSPAPMAARVIRGSAVEFRARASKPIARGSLLVRDGAPVELARLGADRLVATWTADRDIAYDFKLEDEEGLESPKPEFARSIVAVPDAPPSVDVIRPGRDVALAPGEGLPVTLRVEDDVGLAEAGIEVARPAEDEAAGPGRGGAKAAAGARAADLSWKPVLAFAGVRGQRASVPSGWLDAAKAGLAPGSAIVYRARAVDLKGQESRSRSYEVRALTPAEAAARAREDLARARPGIDDVLRRERALRRSTADAKAAAGGPAGGGTPPALAAEQEAIIEAGRQVLAGWDGLLAGDVRRALGRAATEPMPRARRALETAASMAPAGAGPRLDEALREEDEAIAILEDALRRIDRALADLARGELPKAEEAAGRRHGESRELREFIDRLEKFIAEEKKVVVDTKPFLGKEPDDFTGAEKDKLDELAAVEEKWGKYFADAKDDLSKVSPQDMSGSALAEETVELIEEIDLAKDYLKTRTSSWRSPRSSRASASPRSSRRTSSGGWPGPATT